MGWPPIITDSIDYTIPPTAADIEVMLRGAELWPPDDQPLEQEAAQRQALLNINSFVTEFETRTGWKPFVTDPDRAHETRYYPGPSGRNVLFLRGGIITVDSVTVDGNTLVLDRDFFAFPNPDSRFPDAITRIDLQRD